MNPGMLKTNDAFTEPMDTPEEAGLYLIAFGIGACWTGYERAKVVRLDGKGSAEAMGYELATRFREEMGLRYSKGCSYIVEKVSGDLETMSIFKRRLKPEAQQECLDSYASLTQQTTPV